MAVQTFLTTYTRLLGQRLNDTRSQPFLTWEAVFDGPKKTFNEQLAIKMFKGKNHQVVTHHNNLHKDVSMLSVCAKMLGVTPPLVNNDITEGDRPHCTEDVGGVHRCERRVQRGRAPGAPQE